MSAHPDDGLFELRLFIEEIVGDLCRFGPVARDGAAPEAVHVRQEVPVAAPGVFADVVVDVPGAARELLQESEPVETRNVGRILAGTFDRARQD